MTAQIGGYAFGGWYTYTATLDDVPGLYAIGCEINNKVKIIDVGETDTIQSRVQGHDRKDCWEKECKNGTLKYAQHKTKVSEDKRREIEKEIRDKEKPPCGKR